MTILTADDKLQRFFSALKDKTEFRDSQGNILGYFMPRECEEELLYQHADQVFDPKDIQRILEEEKNGSDIEQLMKYLDSLDTAACDTP